jgi:alpha-L-fucosidase
MTMNDTWGYKTHDDNWKSDADLVRKLIDIASKGGNFLLNVGPKADGTIPAPSVTRLKQVGRWLEHNGEAVYGTTKSPWNKHPFNGRCTVDGNTLYVHVFRWDGPVRLPGLKGKVTSVRLVDKRCGEAEYEVTEDQGVRLLRIEPPETPDLVATVVAVECDGPPEVDEDLAHGPPVFQKEDGRIVLTAERAVVHGSTAKYESGGGKDNIGFWTDKNDWVGWPVKVTRPGTFKVEVTYAAAPGSGGATYHVYADAQKVNGRVEETGGWAAFKTVDLGEIEIPKAGRVSMAVKPQSKPGTAVMNLKSVTLTPVK